MLYWERILSFKTARFNVVELPQSRPNNLTTVKINESNHQFGNDRRDLRD